ncbi:GGDEF domain-containing protein [Sphingobium sp. AP50]|uniref:GGDEF domain-containing protein n=1 Tax=Sphingobium sp. AP50 TaxID=1884369 RepID=UPI002739DDCC|nr:GGDEF domain-containing protein [Sphingobium sp. AP50]
MPDAVYRDLVATLFTMSAPILGFGILYALVGSLVYLAWPDQMVLVLVGLGAVVTLFRLIVIHGFHKAGGVSQAVSALKSWEKRYALLTYGFAGLVAAINLRVLATHQPLIHLATVSLIFTFGAGIVSRNAGRPRLCLIGQSIAVVPVAVGMLIHAAGNQAYQLHGQFFILEAILLTVVALMSIQSVRHLYSSAVEHLTAKHDLAKLARYDPLTGLANRLLLRDAFQKAILACRGGNQIAIHCLDLDGFKSINDKFGHPTGDRLLVEVARRLTATVRSDDIIVRLGGDEFLILQTAIQHSDQADLLARRIVRHLSEPYLIDDMQMRVSVSIGIALAPTHGRDLDGLMQCADRALYRSKAGGKAQIHFCDETGIGQPGRAVA